MKVSGALLNEGLRCLLNEGLRCLLKAGDCLMMASHLIQN